MLFFSIGDLGIWFLFKISLFINNVLYIILSVFIKVYWLEWMIWLDLVKVSVLFNCSVFYFCSLKYFFLVVWYLRYFNKILILLLIYFYML